MLRSKRNLLWILGILGIMTVLGGNSFILFYDDLVARIFGDGTVNWDAIAALCGWAGKPNPGETVWDYRWRSTWQMISGRMAVTVFTVVFFYSFYSMLRFIFWMTEKKKKKLQLEK